MMRYACIIVNIYLSLMTKWISVWIVASML